MVQDSQYQRQLPKDYDYANDATIGFRQRLILAIASTTVITLGCLLAYDRPIERWYNKHFR